jgi:hypothetical protein
MVEGLEEGASALLPPLPPVFEKQLGQSLTAVVRGQAGFWKLCHEPGLSLRLDSSFLAPNKPSRRPRGNVEPNRPLPALTHEAGTCTARALCVSPSENRGLRGCGPLSTFDWSAGARCFPS